MSAIVLDPAIDFAALPRTRLRAMVAAGAEVIECVRVLAKTGDNVVGEVLRGQGTFYEWNHYPEGDVYDAESHAQYYYHAHPAALRSGEHGHFHTFLRPRGMPAGVRPAPLPDLALPEGENEALSHLVAISMDPHGVPFRLFTTNRWVTGEVWYAAADVMRMADRFRIGHAQPSWPVNRWISAMMRLFRPQVRALLRARDESIARWASAQGAAGIYEDRALEIASVVDIQIDRQIQSAAAALRRAQDLRD